MNTTPMTPGWRILRVRDIAKSIQYGHTASAEESATGPRFLRITDIQDERVDWSNVPSCRVTADELEKYRLEPGDLVFARTGATTGKSFLIECCPVAVFASYLIRLRLDAVAIPKYLAFFFKSPSYWQQIERGKRGSGQPGVNAKVLGEINVPVAPETEQALIVDDIEKHVTRIDASVAALQRVQANLKRYRASVLKAACEGRLVTTEAELVRREGRDYEPASVLLQRILEERRRRWEEAELAKLKAKEKAPKDDGWKAKYKEPEAPDTSGLPELPEGWCWASVGQVVYLIESGNSFKCEERPPQGSEIGIAKVSAVTWGRYDESASKTCLAAERVDEALFVKTGDFLFTRANTIELVGACVIVDRVTRPIMLSDKILRLHVLMALQGWLLHVLRSPWGREEIERLSTGNQESMRNIGQDRVRAIRIPLPPASDCERALLEIARLLSAAESLSVSVQTDASRAERLRQSILKSAFEGKLVEGKLAESAGRYKSPPFPKSNTDRSAAE